MASGVEAMDEGTPYAIERSACYLIKEKKPDNAYRLFSMLTRTLPGLVITRQHPEKVRRERGVTCRVVWLSHTLGEDFHNPTALGALAKLISNFIDENHGEAVVLLDGLEYIAVNNGFLTNTLMFVEHVNEFVMQRASVILIPVDPAALEEKELALLERNVQVLDGVEIRTELDIREVTRLLESY